MAERKFLYFDETEEGPTESDPTTDTIGLAGLSLTGNLAMSGGATVTGLPLPSAGGEAASKTYVDNVATGVRWKDPVALHGLVGNATVLTVNGLSPSTGDSYVMTDNGTLTAGLLGVVAGDLVEYDGSVWVKIVSAVGGFVPADIRVILSTATALIAPYTDATDDGKIMEFSGSSNTGAATGDAADGNAVLVTGDGAYWENDGFVFDGTVPTGTWIQFTGGGQIDAGAGLSKAGNTLSVNFGDGIIEASDYVAVDLVASNPGLELTGTTPDKKLQAQVDGAHGIIRGASGLEVEIDDTPNTLDVDADGLKVVGLPSLFEVNDVAVGATVTAANFDTLTDTSNADALHTHSAAPATEAEKIEDTHTNNVAVAAKQVVRWSATADEITPAANAGAANARAIGVARTGGAPAATSEIVKVGVCVGAIAGATVNTPYFLGAAGALVLLAAVPKPGRVVRMGYAVNATDLDVQIMDFGKRR